MNLTVNSDFIIFGKEPSTGFTTNFFYNWEDENSTHSAQLYVNFSIGAKGLDGEEFAQELFEVARHHYFQNFERDPHERFEETLNEINKLALEWREKKQMKFFTDVHAVIGIIQGSELFLTQCGSAEAYLIRKRHLTVVSEGLADGNKDRDHLFANVASGELQDYDTVIFSTTRLLRYITKNELAKLFTRDMSLARCFTSLQEQVEMEVDGVVNVLALNIIKQDREAGEESNAPKRQKRGGSVGLLKLVDSIKNAIPLEKVGHKIKGKSMAERGEEVSHVKPRKQHKKPLIDINDLKDFKSLSRDKILVSLVAVIVILLIGLMMVRAQAKNEKRLSEYDGMLTQAQEYLDEARTRGTFDKKKAAEMIDKAEENIKIVHDSGEFRNRALSMFDDIREERDRLDSVIRVEEPVILADLSTKRETVNALGIAPFQGGVYAYEYNALYPILLDVMQDPLTIDQNEQVIDGVYFDDQGSLLFLTESHKVVEFEDNFVKFMDTSDPAWKSALVAETYGDRLYLLDPSENRIWRYRRGREQFSGAESYSVEGDVTDAVDMAIDGSVYVLKADGDIIKYYAGELEDDFQVVRQPLNTVKKPTKMYTEAEFGQVYVLEPTMNRVLVYNKDIKSGNLKYALQYQFDKSAGVLKDIYVDKLSNKLYVLTESKIIQVEI